MMFVGTQGEEEATFHLRLLFQYYTLGKGGVAGAFSKLDLKTVKVKSKEMLRNNIFFFSNTPSETKSMKTLNVNKLQATPSPSKCEVVCVKWDFAPAGTRVYVPRREML